MKRLLIVMLLLGYFSNGAYATEHEEHKYIGVYYAWVDINDGDVENGNLGLVLGGYMDSGIGVEFFYTDTIDEDEFDNPDGNNIKYESQVWGLLGTYRFGQDKVYGLVKAGYVFIDLNARIVGGRSNRTDEDGLAYGIGGGVRVGKNGSVELNYLILPEIEDIDGIQVDAEQELISLGYNWHF